MSLGGVIYIEGAGGGPAGTVFIDDAACVAAWDFTTGLAASYSDACTTDSTDEDVGNNVGPDSPTTDWTSGGTIDSVSVIRTNGGYRLAADGTDLNDLDDASFSHCTMVAIPNGVSFGSFLGIMDRNNTDDFWTGTNNTAGAGYYTGANEGSSAPCASGCDETDILYAVCFVVDTSCGNPTCINSYVLDDDQCETSFAAFQYEPGLGFTQSATSDIEFGCRAIGTNCQDAYIAQAMVLNKAMSEAEIKSFYEYGIDGESWTKTAAATCD